MSERDNFNRDLLVVLLFLTLLTMMLVARSELRDLQRRVGQLESERK